MAKHATHIVWDWNGTLFHDIDAVMAATNASFSELGLPPITLERYREVYCVPVPRFYERIIGRLPTDEEWAVMDGSYHRHYWALADACGLTAGAGRTQSLCSLAPHDRLVPMVAAHGITDHFLRVDGCLGPSGTRKAEQMARHLAALDGIDPRRTVVVGDALDDALAARHVGALAVLYTGGSNSRASLETAGVPVVDSLAEAARVADRLIDEATA